VLTVGTTNLGSVDQIPEISAMLLKLQQEFNIAIYVHVDAAFGGFVLPFLEPEYPFGFQNEAVDSLSVDVHKMGYAPYCSGVFLCRKGFLRYTITKAEYLACHDDSTVCGSRSGAIVAACWMSINILGWNGYSKKLRECMAVREYLRQQLECSLTRSGTPEPVFYPSRMNVLSVRFPARIAKVMRTRNPGCDGKSIQDRFCIPDDNHFPKVFKTDIWEVSGRNRAQVFRFVLMPHVTREKIDQFITALNEGILAQQTSA
jgi:glutamate/tyrosine decarboxylase-like PLP-dependent enzyme